MKRLPDNFRQSLFLCCNPYCRDVISWRPNYTLFETLPCMNLKKHLFLCFLSSILLFLHQNIFESFKKYKICRYVIFLQINDMLYGCHEDVDDVFDDKGDIYI